jgi:hypothetical protein
LRKILRITLAGRRFLRILLRNSRGAMQFETNTAKIMARLEREGWENVGGTKHAKFRKTGYAPIMVPRHRTVTPGVAQSIAKAAGWTK